MHYVIALFIYNGGWPRDLCQGRRIQGQGHKLKAKANAGQSQSQGQKMALGPNINIHGSTQSCGQ